MNNKQEIFIDSLTCNAVRLLGPDGEFLGETSIAEAKAKADEMELDIVVIAPDAKPNPVCRIMDHSKYLYEMRRKEKQNKKNQRQNETKELRLSLNIQENDIKTKAKQAEKFLSDGDRVKLSLKFRGREIVYKDQGFSVVNDVIGRLSEVGVVDKPPVMDGRAIFVTLKPKK